MKVVMVHSYKGGTGKSLFSINYANQLQKLGKRVLLIEADFEMPSYTKLFSENNPDVYFNTYLERQETTLDYYIYDHRSTNLGIIYCAPKFNPNEKVHSTDMDWYNQSLLRLRSDINQLDYDIVIFDMAPGRHLFAINTLVLSNEIIVMMRPDMASIRNTIDIFQDFYKYADIMENKQTDIFINQIPKDDRMDELLSQWRIELKSKLPKIGNIYELNFEHETGYHVATDEIILPDEDPFIRNLKKFIQNQYFQK